MVYEDILLIDDDEDDQEIFVNALEKLKRPVTCTVVDSAVEALHRLRTSQLRPDLIFLDLNMPIMSGQQFLQEIKRENEFKNIPVIILSTSSHATTVQHAKALGAMDFFSKPDKFEDLILLLDSVIQ